MCSPDRTAAALSVFQEAMDVISSREGDDAAAPPASQQRYERTEEEAPPSQRDTAPESSAQSPRRPRRRTYPSRSIAPLTLKEPSMLSTHRLREKYGLSMPSSLVSPAFKRNLIDVRQRGSDGQNSAVVRVSAATNRKVRTVC
uniref:Uncharacterized protein n=1 Tax=Odontella aurita TaxID=265563 RepID=A0A7S4JQ51_9STRA|mmetsp:Transcript_51561/g.154778  ORF Transcript_51561/g.154778 Transcript_51561/m.154778 type:complete len:143 (+) Transcript_51561:108-536(+)